jgi:hypothetical protein
MGKDNRYNFNVLESIITAFRQPGSFWFKNFMSPMKLLRKDKDGTLYIERFLAELKSAKKKPNKPAAGCDIISTDLIQEITPMTSEQKQAHEINEAERQLLNYRMSKHFKEDSLSGDQVRAAYAELEGRLKELRKEGA